MKPTKLRHTVIGGTLLLAALGTSALTLGRPRGAVVIGQPLNVAIPVRLEAGEDASQCYEADVFHADSRIDGSRVSVTLEAGASAQDMVVRVRSATVVDEPVVSIYLRAGCLQRSTRRYVLLADVASEVVAPLSLPSVPRQVAQPPAVQALPPAAAVPAAAARAAARVGTPAASAEGAASGTAPTRAAAERRQRRADAAAAAAAAGTAGAAAAGVAAGAPAVAQAAPPARRESVVKRRVESPASKSRLKLDPLDLLVEADPVLRGSSELITPPSDNPQVRAEAAALWRAINAQPLDILRDSQRLQGLEADVKALRDVSSKNQASLDEFKTRLQKAESERYANGLVYALAALLLAVAALAVFFWYRTRGAVVRGDVWWRGGAGRDTDDEDGLASATRQPVVPAKPLTEVDVDLGMDENLFASLKSRTLAPVPAQPPPRFVRSNNELSNSDFAPSMPGMPGMSRAVNAEELFDIQQQADFFVSLGQHEQAIEVLKNHISDNVETSALAYLDLLKIYHSLERREDYDLLREDFNRVFNAQVPPFDSYSDQSNGLESYHTAMSRIEALWPSPKVLEIIEESIFRKPGTGDGEAFDLEAYRELLLLYAMAKDVVDRRGGDSMDFELSGPASTPPDSRGDPQPARAVKFSSTSIQPLSATNYSETGAGDLLPDIPMPRPSPRLGIDIDLTDTGSPSAFMRMNEEAEPDMGDFHSESTVEDLDSRGDSRFHEPKPAADSHLIDFDLFDAATERDIAPRGKADKTGKR